MPKPVQFQGCRYRTQTQLFLLSVFYKYRYRVGGRKNTYPSLRDLVIELNGNISPRGVYSHILAMVEWGDLVNENPGKWRPWRLTPQGMKRAKQRIATLKKMEARQRERDAERRKRLREDAKPKRPPRILGASKRRHEDLRRSARLRGRSVGYMAVVLAAIAAAALLALAIKAG